MKKLGRFSTMGIESYEKLFSVLRKNGCEKLLNYVFCQECSSVSDEMTKCFDGIKENIYVFTQPCSDYFSNDDRNGNHFIISRYWNTIIPKVLEDCGFCFNIDDYGVVLQKDDIYGYDLSYHEKNSDNSEYTFKSFSNENFTLTSNHHKVFREGNGMSMYHRLCRDTHYSYEVCSDKNGETCFILCDSMVSPVIPILAYYFKKLLVFDVSHHFPIICSIKDKIETERPKFCLTFHTELHYKTGDMFGVNL